MLTVQYDGSCSRFRREITHAQRSGDAALCFVDISREAESDPASAAERHHRDEIDDVVELDGRQREQETALALG